MDPKAVSKAKARLLTATSQLRSANEAKSYEDFASHWYLFLVSAKNVYTQLEQGAKLSARSRQWFGGEKNERRNDPLLQYLFQARDDDEHGIGDVTKLQPGATVIGENAPGFSSSMSIKISAIGPESVTIDELVSRDGKPILIGVTPARAILLPVTGRGDVVYSVPTEHLGKPIVNRLPVTVGEMAIAYLEALIDEAALLAA